MFCTRRLLCAYLIAFVFLRPGACADSPRAEDSLELLRRLDDENVQREVTADFRDLGILNSENNRLSANATLQSFVDRESGGDVENSILGVLWPTKENNYTFTFALYLPNGSEPSLHAMHVCGFLFSDNCLNVKPYPGKAVGRCGESDAANAQATGYFCDFVALHEKAEPTAGIFASGSESLERLAAHIRNVGDAAFKSVELHFELLALGDYDGIAAAPPPAGAARKLFALRGPAYAGAHMTLQAGPGRRSYITLPGALGG